MNKFFFMAALTANLAGVARVGFNVVVALDRRNVLASGLTRIQQSGAQMVIAEGMVEGVDFDNIVVQNLFFLAECTEEEFVAGTELSAPAAESTPLNDALEQVQEGVAASLADAPADLAGDEPVDPTKADLNPDNVEAEEQLEAGKQGE